MKILGSKQKSQTVSLTNRAQNMEISSSEDKVEEMKNPSQRKWQILKKNKYSDIKHLESLGTKIWTIGTEQEEESHVKGTEFALKTTFNAS